VKKFVGPGLNLWTWSDEGQRARDAISDGSATEECRQRVSCSPLLVMVSRRILIQGEFYHVQQLIGRNALYR
jgi:hypothetical protein